MRNRRPRTPPSPLAQLRGVDPVRLRMPVDGDWATVRDHLVQRLPVGDATVDAMIAEGRIVGADGTAIAADTPYAPGGHVWFHRELAPEATVPFTLDVVYRDEHILVADKPHFLATTPRGSHITETALARLRRDTGIEGLGPAHRLDRLTAGLVLFVVRPEERGTYQTLFRDRLVGKEYEAVAAYDPDVELPVTLRSRIEKERGVLTALEVPGGEPNAETRVRLADRKGRWGRYRLTPHTGRTHQLRVHMNSLGLPILGDPLYPRIADPTPPDDFRRPLQLLARTLEFKDPVTGREHRFASTRKLEAWESYGSWDQ
ncbi:pseudouridylate synthase [Streptomyces sp. SID14478]|uniref:RluA family pseudouridine synthase n=1 Tax=Streptomyces sp. SID14478 TaxID=2706073 RepID=UPI0013DFB072|nr:RluA family pseudouridine synthase [Streptomyces sp. SID14478]NEB81995.1 pseudouridylate synthase [Streptomyces sp. SID14478]